MSIEVVRQVKSELDAAGVNLLGPCGAFEIVKRVAWRLRNQGYGLLGGKNPAQNGCTVGSERYSVDWIMKADGTGVDILLNAGGSPNNPTEPTNVPVWGEGMADPALYRPAIDPGDMPIPAPEPPPNGDIALILARLDAHDAQLYRHDRQIHQHTMQISALTMQVDVLEHKPYPNYIGTGKVFGFYTVTVRSRPDTV